MTDNDKKVGAGFGVMVKKGNKILLGKRNDDPEKASSALSGEGTWTMPGGKFEFGESFEEGAKREVLEETGIILNKVEIICVNNNKTNKAHFVTIGMYSDKFKGEAKVMEPDEITEWKWFDLKSLPKKLFFPSKKIVENFRKSQVYIPKQEK